MSFSITPAELSCRTPCEVEVVVVGQDRRVQRLHLVDFYEDRWFFEDPVDHRQCLFFDRSNQKQPWLWLDCNKVRLKKVIGPSSELRDELIERRVVMDIFPTIERTLISTSDDGHHKAEKWLGNFAIDIQAVDRSDSVFSGDGMRLKDHYSFGAKVYSPVSGKVVKVVRNQKDKPIDLTMTTQFDEKEQVSNYILIHIDGPYYFVLVHFKKDTIPHSIDPGKYIKVGDYLGEIGNSGVSYLPHLHMTSYMKDEVSGRMVSIPTLINDSEGPFQFSVGDIVSAGRQCSDLFRVLQP